MSRTNILLIIGVIIAGVVVVLNLDIPEKKEVKEVKEATVDCNTPTKLSDIGSFPGEGITLQGSMLGTDQEMLEKTVDCFEKATGATVQYSGSRDFAALIVADLRSNNAPNIAIFPQPTTKSLLPFNCSIV